MQVIQEKELKQIQLDILSSVDKYCRKKDIKYFLTGGTCIGAVRHHGYIPWDDDIDIGMTRPNYNRFIREYNIDEERDFRLKVYAPELDWNYYAPYANVCDTRTLLIENSNGHNGMQIGVKIDVFPIDGIPSSRKAYRKEKQIICKLWNILYEKRSSSIEDHSKTASVGLKSIIRHLVLSFISYSIVQRIIKWIITSHPYEKSQYAIDVVFPWKRDVMCPRAVYEELVEVAFENLSVFIMKDYHQYLTLKYGDYMQLPPEEKRVPHHGFEAYWLEK